MLQCCAACRSLGCVWFPFLLRTLMFPLITQFICLVAFFVLSLTTPARYLVSIPTTVVLLPYLAYIAYYYGGKDANERKDASRRKAAFFIYLRACRTSRNLGLAIVPNKCEVPSFFLFLTAACQH